jgi:hypothetical protein
LKNLMHIPVLADCAAIRPRSGTETMFGGQSIHTETKKEHESENQS